MKNEKLYKLCNNLNRHNKTYLYEDKYSREERKAREYLKKNGDINSINGIKTTYTTGVRTYKNFGIYDIEKSNKNTPKIPEKKEIDKTAVKYNFIKLMMSRNGA